MDTDYRKMERKLKERIEANYRSYLEGLQNKTVNELVEQAAEIAAVKLVYEELLDGCSPEYMEYLLRFENPLELVSDQWLSEQNAAHSDEMAHVLWEITDKGLGEGDYAMAEKPMPSNLNEGVQLC